MIDAQDSAVRWEELLFPASRRCSPPGPIIWCTSHEPCLRRDDPATPPLPSREMAQPLISRPLS